MKKHLLGVFGVAFLFGSCGNDIDSSALRPEGELKVSAVINQAQTRATDSQWETEDLIGLSDDKGDFNIPYSATTTAGAFEPVDGNIVLKGSDTYTFTAYYPYSENLSESGEITFDVVDESSHPVDTSTIDFLYASAVTATRANSEINLQFSHKMAKIALTFINSDQSIPDEYSVEYTLDNVVTDGVFNAKDGSVTPGSQAGQFKSEASLNLVSNVILPSFTTIPEAINIKVSLTANGKTDNYSGEITPALMSGCQYNYTLDIVNGEGLKITSGSITQWNPVEGEGNLNPSDKPEPASFKVGDYLLNDGSVLASDSEELSSKKGEIVGVVYYVGNPQPSVKYSESFTESQDILKNYYPNATRGLAIALEDASTSTVKFSTNRNNIYKWFNDTFSDNNKYIGTNLNLNQHGVYMLGYNNTKLLEEWLKNSSDRDLNSLMTLISSYKSLNPVEDASTWYIPSMAELDEVFENFEVINESINKARGEEIKQFKEYRDDLVRSVENNEQYYWSSDLKSSNTDYENCTWGSPMRKVQSEYFDKLYQVRTNNAYLRLSIAF